MIAFINVAGCMDRIGTTTQAVQLTRFIKSMDYDVAYMEMNDKNYIRTPITFIPIMKKNIQE